MYEVKGSGIDGAESEFLTLLLSNEKMKKENKGKEELQRLLNATD